MIRASLDQRRKFFSVSQICLKELRERWGTRLHTYRDRSDIALLYSLTRDGTTSNPVVNSTRFDIDQLDELRRNRQNIQKLAK